MKINRVELGLSLALLTAIIGAGSYAPIEQSYPAESTADTSTASQRQSLQSYWRATMQEFRSGWRSAFGDMQGDSYQLYATLGNADTETARRFHDVRFTDDVSRVFSSRF